MSACAALRVTAVTRRAVVAAAASTAGVLGRPFRSSAATASFSPSDPDWLCFRRRYVSPDGRVIDTGNNNVSHSEGQSYGMLFAVTFNDQPTFDRIRQWTQENLKRSADALYIWRWLPNKLDHTPDRNNATDGDLIIAMALLRAATVWHVPAYQTEALAIAQAIRMKLVASNPTQLVLLPGLHGFAGSQSLTLNPSYYNFVALQALASIDPSPVWEKLATDGQSMIEAARFGRWMLPPDWLSVDRGSGTLGIAGDWPPLCSYDAIRVPLNLVWARTLTPAIAAGFDAFWTSAASYQPAWANLRTNAVSSYAARGGLIAVRRITAARAAESSLGSLPTVASCTDYYSSALTVLARIAWMESQTG